MPERFIVQSSRGYWHMATLEQTLRNNSKRLGIPLRLWPCHSLAHAPLHGATDAPLKIEAARIRTMEIWNKPCATSHGSLAVTFCVHECLQIPICRRRNYMLSKAMKSDRGLVFLWIVFGLGLGCGPSQPASQPRSQPASQPVSQPAGQPANHPASQPSSQAVRQPSSQPASAT